MSQAGVGLCSHCSVQVPTLGPDSRDMWKARAWRSPSGAESTAGPPSQAARQWAPLLPKEK